jgi:hypothetical protein
MSRLQQSKNYGPSGGASFGGLHAPKHHPLRTLGRQDVFRELSDKGKGRVMNLICGRRDRFGYPVPGTGRASRLSKPELTRVIADILAKHRGVQNYGRI